MSPKKTPTVPSPVLVFPEPKPTVPNRTVEKTYASAGVAPCTTCGNLVKPGATCVVDGTVSR